MVKSDCCGADAIMDSPPRLPATCVECGRDCWPTEIDWKRPEDMPGDCPRFHAVWFLDSEGRPDWTIAYYDNGRWWNARRMHVDIEILAWAEMPSPRWLRERMEEE